MKSLLILLITFSLFNWCMAQSPTETLQHDQLIISTLLKKVKKQHLDGDCQCSQHLHKNYPIIFADSIKENTTDVIFLFFSNLKNNPFSENETVSSFTGIENEPLFKRIDTRTFPFESKKIKNKKPYYITQMYNPVRIDDKIYGIFELLEIRSDKNCTPIQLIFVLDANGTLLETKTETSCD